MAPASEIPTAFLLVLPKYRLHWHDELTSTPRRLPMDNFQPAAHVLQLVLWSAYFVLHSALATARVRASIIRRWPALGAHYRATYNVVAVVLLVPVATLVTTVPGALLWSWPGVLAHVRDLLTLGALGAAWYAGRAYPLRSFLFGTQADDRSLLVISPIHRYVRHPWYAFGLILVWTRDMDLAMFISAVAITVYLLIGSRLEDRKLVAQYGDAYKDFQLRVPGLLPWPGRHLSVPEADVLLDRANRPSSETARPPDLR